MAHERRAQARLLVGEAGLPSDAAARRVPAPSGPAPQAGGRRRAVILSVDLESALPPYEQIRAQIMAMAASGVLPPGTRLPTIRQLSADLGLAPGTVSRAYRELDAAGVISARGRHGTFIARPPALTPRQRASRLAQAAANYAQAAAQLGAGQEEASRALAQAMAAWRQNELVSPSAGSAQPPAR